MKIALQHQTIKKLVGAIAVGSFAFVPAAGIVSAQAAPPRHAPAYGQRGKAHKGDYGRKDRHRSNSQNNNRYNHNQTITGVVTQNYRGSQFNLRMSNGRTIRVDANRHAPRGLNNGDQVRVYGRYVNNVFSASSIAVIARNRNNRDRYDRDRYNRNNDYRSYVGVVTKVRSKRAFDIRIDGKVYNVTLSNNAPRNLNRNDTVRVYGKRSGSNDIKNASVSVSGRR